LRCSAALALLSKPFPFIAYLISFRTGSVYPFHYSTSICSFFPFIRVFPFIHAHTHTHLPTFHLSSLTRKMHPAFTPRFAGSHPQQRQEKKNRKKGGREAAPSKATHHVTAMMVLICFLSYIVLLSFFLPLLVTPSPVTHARAHIHKRTHTNKQREKKIKEET
jgi:hypothetical protein